MSVERKQPVLFIECSCGQHQAYALKCGKRVRYVGLNRAKVLTGLFRHFHEKHGGEVTEEILNPNYA